MFESDKMEVKLSKSGSLKMDTKKTLVFVYGTLKEGHGNNHVIQSENTVKKGAAVTEEKYTMYRSGIPYVDKTKETSIISGEVYEIDQMTLARVDRLEGYRPNNHEGSWYKREAIPVRLVDTDEVVTAFIYFNTPSNTDALELVEDGIYK